MAAMSASATVALIVDTRMNDRSILVQRFRSAALVAAITIALVGCSGDSGGEAGTFVDSAEAAGLRCVETVPPEDDVVVLRTCQGADSVSVSLTVFASEEARSKSETGVDPESTYVGHGRWLIVGDDPEIVNSLADDLGGSTP